jgi:hypothetical protein
MAKRSVAHPAQKLQRLPFKASPEKSIFLEIVLMAFRAVSGCSQDRALAIAASLYEELASTGLEGGTMPEEKLSKEFEPSVYLHQYQLEKLREYAYGLEGEKNSQN